MKVQGAGCSLVIKTAYREFDVPYSEETLREAVLLLPEEASIEGDGVCRAIRKKGGVTGCVVTPLTLRTVEHLLYLALGLAGHLEFVSGTRNLYRYCIAMLPVEDTECFDLIQDRTGNRERRLFEGCGVSGFELRIMRDEVIKLKLDIRGERGPVAYPYTDTFTPEKGERFSGENVTYRINGKDYRNIYGLTLATRKEGGTKTEVWIRRCLEKEPDIPETIDELIITARLLRDKYEARHFGEFRVTVTRLVLTSDETNVNSGDTVIGPLRYYAAGAVGAEVFSSGGEALP